MPSAILGANDTGRPRQTRSLAHQEETKMSECENQDISDVICAMMKINPPIKGCMAMLRADSLALFLTLVAKYSVFYYHECQL